MNDTRDIYNPSTLLVETGSIQQCPRCRGFGSIIGDDDGCQLCNSTGSIYMTRTGCSIPSDSPRTDDTPTGALY